LPVKRVAISRYGPAVVTLIQTLLKRRNQLTCRGKTEKAAELSGKIGKLTSENKSCLILTVDIPKIYGGQ
jgi:hypothetical protein